MTIILFLIDTSASMNARTYLGARPTLLDVSKDAVEKFLKLRQRDLASRGDRYMLLTFEENPANIKAGWKENHNVFMNELKNLTANGMTTLGSALKNCFDLLNLNRMQTGIDTYGQGRCPYFFEPAIIIVITDGGKLSNTSNVQEELNLPMHSCVPGSELTKEPFRWDQRLFSLVLRLTGTPPNDQQFTNGNNTFIPYDTSVIDAMCDVTGGRSYMVNSQRSLNLCLESIVNKIQGGVVIHFERIGTSDPPAVKPTEQQSNNNGDASSSAFNTPATISNSDEQSNQELSVTNDNPKSHFPFWHTCRKQIYVQRSAQKGYSVGHWPIPEAFWPDLNSQQLLPRTCHPIVKFSVTESDPMIIDQLPFDKYEIESCQLTNYILLRKQPHVAWQCFISNSGNNAGFYNNKTENLGLPFGYLKASTNLTCVNLYVLPYNYPVLLPLLDELIKVHHGRPSREWKTNFDNYLRTMPLYYAQPLKRALQRMSVPNLVVPDTMDACLSLSVLNYLKRVKNQAKIEFERLVLQVGKVQTLNHMDSIKLITNPYTKRLHDLVLINNDNNNENQNGRKASTTDKNSIDAQIIKNQKILISLRSELNEFSGFSLRIRDRMKEAKPQCFKNAFDINRNDLIDQISRMKINFLQRNINDIKMHTDEQLHSLPIAQMGNYQEYLKKLQPSLRELEQQPVRQHMFGNPFKFDKKVQMMVDEADIDLVNNGGNVNHGMNKGLKRPLNEPNQGNSRLIKRKPGPLPKDFVLKRPGSNSSINNNQLSNNISSSNQLLNNIQLTNLTSSNNLNATNGLINSIDKQPNSESDGEANFIMNRTVNNLMNNNSFTERSPSPANSIDSLSDNSLSSLDSSLSDLNDSELDNSSSPTPISFLMSMNSSSTNSNQLNNSLNNQLNNQIHNHSTKPLTGLHLLSKQSMIMSPTTNSLVNLTDDDIQMKKLLFKQIRRPGNNYESLINSLAKHRNSMVKNYLVNEVINEAKKFKKNHLVNILFKKFPYAKSYSTNGS